MSFKFTLAFLVSLILTIPIEQVLSREQWLERDGRAVFLYPRRFGQESSDVLQSIRDACSSAVCDALAGQAVTPLLSAQPECSQQDMADSIIDASKQFDAATAAAMVRAAVEYRQVEKNTSPDFSKSPPAFRNSVYCQKAPKNPQLEGLVQAQDPANNPDLFFDPVKQMTVFKGSQTNTFPFGGALPKKSKPSFKRGAHNIFISSASAESSVVLVEAPNCPPAIQVTVTVMGSATATPTDAGTAVTVSVGGTVSVAPPAVTNAPPAGADFGSCPVPQIEFGSGFDGRTETSFQPVDKKFFNHGSAQDIGVITQFICNTLAKNCNANQPALDLCAQATASANIAVANTGAQADAFNALFGINTDFASVTVIDNQGNVIGGDRTPTSSNPVSSASGPATTLDATTPRAPAPTLPLAAAVPGNGIGNFGSCSVPQIEFAVGFDGRQETSFQPVDKNSYNHGSATNIDVITQFICNDVASNCNADANAKATCAKGTAAASAAVQGGGSQADAFNAAFGLKTDFAAVTQVDNQGNPVGVIRPAQANTSIGNNNVDDSSANNANANTSSSNNSNNPGNNPSNNEAATIIAGNLQTFTGSLGGVVAPPVTALGTGKFQVTGNAVINSQKDAILRSCDVQNNLCANAANASRNQNGFTVAACSSQLAQCKATAN